ncbi:MAG: SPOR domain-containing protein [Candidatus Omnitrophica bacterium]|nr:SPOR domain-containing protein [Candidatus Omnitrophota bacterium]
MRNHRFKLFLTAVFLAFGITSQAYALNLDTIKVYYMKGDYKSAITEGERTLSRAGNSDGLDELYYILGLSYLRDGNYLRASDIFEIILNEFKSSKLQEEARLGLGDAAFLSGDMDKAQGIYEGILNSNAPIKLKAKIYYRLSSIAFKKGLTDKGKEYRDKLAAQFPANSEGAAPDEALPSADKPTDFYYTVQTGSFSNSRNANNLSDILVKKGYPAFVEEGLSAKFVKIYRVKVGRLKSRQEALNLEERLSREGYPTKVLP